MNLLQILLEELNDNQKNYLRYRLDGSRYKPDQHHTDMFDSYEKNNPNRIVLPYENTEISANNVDINIRQHLAKNGWGIHNYRAGLASRQSIDREGNPKLEVKKIGKILQETGGDKVNHPEMSDRLIKGEDGKPIYRDGRMVSEKVPQNLLHFYNNDPKRSSKSSSNIVISRDLDDIGGMSSGRTWEGDSCMRLPQGKVPEHTNHKIIKEDLKRSTLVAYSTKTGDDDIENPMGRTLIKQYHGKLKDGSYHTIYRTENKTYGNAPPEFRNQVESIISKHYPAINGISYKLSDSLYNDGRLEVSPIQTGLKKSGKETTNRNELGQLHDYVDENGVKQPAKVIKGELIEHYKNGKLHNENGAASIKKTHDGEIHYHAINGEYHRLGGKPAVEFIPNKPTDKKIEEYHVGGLRHRDGDLPAIDRNDDNGKLVAYYKFGMEHRDGGKVSSTDNNGFGDMTIRNTYGQLNSPTNNTPAIEYKNDTKHSKMYYKDDKLHRDNDLPAEHHIDGDEVTKKWYQHGKLKRDNDSKPHTIKYNKDTKEISEKQWNRPEGSKLPTSYNNDGDREIKTFSIKKDETGHIAKGLHLISTVKTKDNLVKQYLNKGTYSTHNITTDNNGIISHSVIGGGNRYLIVPDKHGNTHLIAHDNNIVITKDGETKLPFYKKSSADMNPIQHDSNDILDMVNNAHIMEHPINKKNLQKHFDIAISLGGEVAKRAKQLKKLVK